MAILEIKTYPDPVLKSVASAYKEITDEDRKLAQDMLETMYADRGVGLAAPQIGLSKRLIVCSPEFKKNKNFIFFNPVIKARRGEVLGPEGCLSLPGISGEVVRAEEIDFEALNEMGEKVSMTVNGFFARVLQHEVDHLDGVLFVDQVHFEERKTLLETYHDSRLI